MQSSSRSRDSRGGSRHPHPDRISPHAHPQALGSPTVSQSPSFPPHAFPTPFPTPQHDYPSQSMPTAYPSSLLSPPNWQRPRASSSYSLESATLAFPEPQLYRQTSSEDVSHPPPPPPRTPRRDLETTPRITPALSHRNSTKFQGAEVALRFHFRKTSLMCFFAWTSDRP